MNKLNINQYINKTSGDSLEATEWNGVFTDVQTSVNNLVDNVNNGLVDPNYTYDNAKITQNSTNDVVLTVSNMLAGDVKEDPDPQGPVFLAAAVSEESAAPDTFSGTAISLDEALEAIEEAGVAKDSAEYVEAKEALEAGLINGSPVVIDLPGIDEPFTFDVVKSNVIVTTDGNISFTAGVNGDITFNIKTASGATTLKLTDLIDVVNYVKTQMAS